MCVRWLATVRSPRKSVAATSRFVRPSATRAATRRSAGVRPSSRVRPPMLPSSDLHRSIQVSAPSCSNPASDAEGEECTRPAVGIADLLVTSNRVVQEQHRLVDLSAGGCDLAPTPQDVNEDPLSSKAPRAGFPRVEYFHRLVDPTELEQRLDVVVGPGSIGGVQPPELQRARVRTPEPLGAGRSISTPQSDQPDDREVVGRMKSELLLGELECPRRRLPREVELAAMDGDPGDREMVLGYLDSVLKRDVARPSGMLGGELPAAQLELDQRQLPKGIGASRLVAFPPPLVLIIEELTAGLIADADRPDVSHQVLQPRLSGLAGELERFGRPRLSVLVADCRTEIRQDGECSHLERVIVKTLCELERGAGALVGLDEPLAEADRRGEPELDVRLQYGARLGF